MEQQGTVNNRTFVLLNFGSIILAPPIYIIYHISYVYMYGNYTNIYIYIILLDHLF